MSAMHTVASLAIHRRFDPQASLPRPNIYWATVHTATPEGSTRSANTYLAADHTALAVQRLTAWCEKTQGFVPTRSNSSIKVRRMLLGDLIADPDLYGVAVANARAADQYAVLASLEELPGIIARMVGIDVDVSLQGLSAPLWDAQPAPVRELRPSVA